jgi:hypothetical protein
MGSVQIFTVALGPLTLACSRDFAGAYVLETGASRCAVSLDTASALASAGQCIRDRARIAVVTDKELKPGAVFQMDSNGLRVELGITDAGDGVYIEANSIRVTLDDVQSQDLLHGLGRLRADVDAVWATSAQPVQFNLTRAFVEDFVPAWAKD